VKTVFAKILLWCAAMLLFSLLGFVALQIFLGSQGGGITGYIGKINQAAFGEARAAFESGGPEELRQHLALIDSVFLGQYYLLDARGIDVATGEDRSRWAELGKSRWGFPGRADGQIFFTMVAGDGRYQFLGVARPGGFEIWPTLAYPVTILGGLALLCWALAVNIARPLRRLTEAMDRFGAGDLRARVGSKREDEIGKLSGAFDRLADRIETLLTAERRLLQDISHELRTPLSRLSFAAELIPPAEGGDSAAAKVKKEVRRMASLVGALVEMTRQEGDPAAHLREPLRLDSLLREIAEDCTPEAEARGCRLEFAAASEGHLPGDPELLRRALENVTRNAIHYSPSGDRVEIRLEADAAAIRVRVRDYGPGVPEEYLKKIFQPFYRVDSSREASTGGVGLGLAIAQRAIALHHGIVTARNVNPGLEVTVELPVSAFPPPAAPKSSAPEQ